MNHMRRRCTLFALTALLSVPVCAATRFTPLHEWCIQNAASHYYRNTDPVTYAGLIDLVHAVMGVEYGCGGQHRNDNGSVDYGCMQINSDTLRRLAQAGYGFDPAVVQYNDCQNILLGTWAIETELESGRDLWTAIGNYNSHTPKFNRAYQLKVWRQLQLIWANRLAGR